MATTTVRKIPAAPPEAPPSARQQGLTLLKQGRAAEAIPWLQEAQRCDPESTEVANNLGVALAQHGRLNEATACFARVADRQPTSPQAAGNLGLTALHCGQPDLAERHLRRALELDPASAATHTNLGVALAQLGRPTEAIAAYDEALRRDPEYADAHSNRSRCLLLLGQFEEGWSEYEWRWRTRQQRPRQMDKPLWDGAPISGRTLLLHAEQGLGDTLQMVRYAKVAKALGAGRVLLECPASLRSLLSRCQDVDLAVATGQPVPAFEVHAPLWSMPRLCGTRSIAAIPGDNPYLFAEPVGIAAWRDRLRPLGRCLVGIVWQGSASFGGDRDRSVLLEQFAPLSQIAGVRLVSLQKGAGTEQLARAGTRLAVHDIGANNWTDFEDAAAVVANLDLVVSVDTAIGHLAGALGVPVFLALPFACDFRWLQQRTDSPWYPTHRLFRQSERGNWQSVFAEIGAEVSRFRDQQSPLVSLPKLSSPYEQGMSLLRAARHAEAIPLLQAASRESPTFAAAHHNLGVALAQLRRLDEAIASFLAALRLNPKAADLHGNLALAYHQIGKLADAVHHYEELLRLNPNAKDVHRKLGDVCRDLQRYDESAAHYQRALEFDPNDVEAYHGHGLLLARQGQLEPAAERYRQAVRIKPGHADALNNLGVVLQDLGKSDEAIATLQLAVAARPASSEMLNNLGIALSGRNRIDEAVASYREAIRLNPGYPACHSNLGNALRKLGQLDEAAAHLLTALRLQPEYPEARNNLGIVYLQQGNWSGAVAEYEAALQLKPDYGEAHLNRSLARLGAGDYERGWPEYEWRWRGKVRPRTFAQPAWQGEPLLGKTLLVYAEQGLGDTIQFVRYLPLVKGRSGATIVLECQRPLVELLAGCPGVDRLVANGDSLPEFDAQVALLSVPQFCGTTNPEAIPAPGRYLQGDAEHRDNWQKRLRSPGRYLIGIAWQGNPGFAGDRQRSVSLQLFGALAKIPGVRLISLQKGSGVEQLASLKNAFAVEDIGADSWKDFHSAAAVVQAVDLVVSVDTAIAHLAGALDVPVYLALPFAADWRWLRQRDDTPWYTGHRLFRQPRPGAWDDVFSRIAALVAEKATERLAELSEPADLHTRAVELVKTGHLEMAVDLFRRALRLAPTSVATLHNLGAALAKLGQLDEAISTFKSALSLAPDSTLGLANLGLAYLQTRRYGEAEQVLTRAVSLDDTMVDAQHHLGIALARLGRPVEAIPHWKRAVALRPAHLEAWRQLASAARDTNQFAEEIACYRVILQHRPADSDALLHLAQALETQGDLRSAVQCYIQLSKLPHVSVTHLHQLARLQRRLRDVPGAIATLRRVLDREPKQGEAWNDLGLALADARQLDEAADAYARALEIRPKFGEALNNLGIVRKEQGRFADAVAAYQRALEHLPSANEIWSNLGIAQSRLNRFDDSATSFREAIRLKPDSAEAHNNLANALTRAGKLDDAIATYQIAIQLRPDYASAHTNLALAYSECGKFDLGVASAKRAVDLDPRSVEALNGLAVLQAECGATNEAVTTLRRALEIKPGYVDAYNNLGNVLFNADRLDEAADSLHEALRLKPDYAEALSNLGIVRAQQSRLNEALDCYNKALAIRPDYADAHLNCALALLVRGELAQGWDHYEWRWRRKGRKPRGFKAPAWDGQPLAGRTILLHAEQGLGDTIQFARYATEVRARGAGKIIVECQAPLIPLLEGAANIDAVVVQGKPLPEFDTHAPLLSLPRLCGTTLETLPSSVGYLRVDLRLRAYWRRRFAESAGLKVGLVWRGNPKFPGDRRRSIPLDKFAPLLQVPGVQFFSLQKGTGEEEYKGHGLVDKVLDLGAREWADFGETAAVIENLDLVVSVDTAVAHLAGALGRPVWIALPAAADWRWLEHTDRSLWYPSARLFRQTTRGDWAAVFERMSQTLAELPRPSPSERATALTRVTAEAQQRRGLKLLQAKEYADAIDALQNAIQIEPGQASAHFGLGIAFAKTQRLDDASATFRRAVKLFPKSAAAHGNLGLALVEQGKFDEAITSLREALRFDPRSADTLANLGVALTGLRRFAEAIDIYEQALCINPDSPRLRNNLGKALCGHGQPELALQQYVLALARQPRQVEALNNRGIAMIDIGDDVGALAAFDQALAINSSHLDARRNRAMALLRIGDYARGWPAYEARLDGKVRPGITDQPAWDGSPLLGKTILLYAEQGLGDTIQFSRYGELVKARGGRVVLQCQEPLVELLRACPAFDQVVATQSVLPSFDMQAALLSLPHLCGTAAEMAIPAAVPYLRCDVERQRYWRSRLHDDQRLAVGIVWQGNPEHGNDHERSIALAQFAPLARITEIRLVSLQKGAGVEQLQALDGVLPVEDIGAASWTDFRETAAVVAALDLIISIDSAVAHLAGALGVPTWVLLPIAPDWRWLRTRDTTPWYPRHRLFRQTVRGDWGEVFRRVAQCLAESCHTTESTSPQPTQTTSTGPTVNSLSARGVACVRDGALEEAVQHFEQALAIEPDAVAVHVNLGVALARLGRLPSAITAFTRAAALKPAAPELRGNLTLALLQAGRFADAEVCVRETLRLRPLWSEAHNQHGLALTRLERRPEAEQAYRRAIELQPDFADAHNNLGNLLRAQNNNAEAVTCFERALQVKPDLFEARSNLGYALLQTGKVDEGLQALRVATELQPALPQAHANLALALLQKGKAALAIASFRRAIELRPQKADLHSGLGHALREVGQLDEAVTTLQRALEFDDKHTGAWTNLGMVRARRNELEEAADCYRRVLTINPNHNDAGNNLGVVLNDLGLVEEAVAIYDRVVERNPDGVLARQNRSLSLLRQGDYQRGWTEYEWRWRGQNRQRAFAQLAWDGGPIDGKTLLIYAEQGLGDTLQFVRYAPLAKARGATVVLECQPPLAGLLQNAPGVDRVVAQGHELPLFDAHAALLSLPRCLGTNCLDAIPAEVPYLRASPERVARWRQRFADSGSLKVGIAWQGNPGYGGDRNRSTKLERFAPLAQIPGVRLVSIQKGVGVEQIRDVSSSMTVEEIGADTWPDFAEAAAAISALDLVISVDTAVAHLAGSLGVPTWVALPFASDWRWLRGRDDSPWYPRHRLFRQTKQGNWDSVFQRLTAALFDLVREHGTTPDVPRLVESPSLLHRQGVELVRAGKLDEAIASFRRAAELAPGSAATFHNLGAALAKAGQLVQAVSILEESLRLAPDSGLCHANLGLAYLQLGQLGKAEAALTHAIRFDPKHVEAHNHLGIAHARQQRFDVAIERYRAALALRPDFADVWNNLGNALRQAGQFDEAATALDEALRLRPRHVDTLNNRAIVLSHQGKLDDAANCYLELLTIQPQHPEALNNLGVALADLGRIEEAIPFYDRVLQLQPDNAGTHQNRALAWLRLGQLERGWVEYEWRWQGKNRARDLGVPMWDGSPLADKTILLHAEQGLGDTIQFVRYAAVIRAQGAKKVILECPNSLVQLLRSTPGVDLIAVQGRALPAFDTHAPLLSLPRLCGTKSIEDIPAKVPYLRADAARVAHWRKSLYEPNRLTVGIAWQGNPGYAGDRWRSVPLLNWTSLAEVSGIRLVSLQQGVASTQQADLRGSLEILDVGAENWTDFSETAAVASALDLVISVDTAVAHLAGALGVPTWLLTPAASDWRWLRDREDSPWYPHHRLFRQGRRGSWTEVFERIRAVLEEHLRQVPGLRGERRRDTI